MPRAELTSVTIVTGFQCAGRTMLRDRARGAA
jgi:hypothetical protein